MHRLAKEAKGTAHLDVGPVNFLSLILSLLHFEDMLVEMLLQLLVGKVNAELCAQQTQHAVRECARGFVHVCGCGGEGVYKCTHICACI